MTIRVCTLLLLALFQADAPPSPIARAALAFLETLDEGQRAKLRAPFGSGDREDWTYMPRRRPGLPIKEMRAPQKKALEAMLAAALSRDGLAKAKGVITLEGVLVELGASPVFRDPGLYYARIYGTPGEQWGFSFEGHHLSLNYTSQKGTSFSGTPAFFGANPHRVPRGKHAGMRLLAEEEDQARALLRSLSDRQRRRALWTERSPREIVTRDRSFAKLESFVGLPAADLDGPQSKALRALVELHVRKHGKAVADDFLARVDKAGFDKVHFAWAGSIGPDHPHYYRVHGPTFVIEYVNAQDGANHSHTVLRDFKHDFGRDWLAEHLQEEHR